MILHMCGSRANSFKPLLVNVVHWTEIAKLICQYAVQKLPEEIGETMQL